MIESVPHELTRSTGPTAGDSSSVPTALQEVPVVHGEFPCHDLGDWAAAHGVVAGITSRGADFGLGSPEPAQAVLDRWRRFRGAMRPSFSAVMVAHQCHGTTFAIHQAPASGWKVEDDVDGHLTREPGCLLAVTVADCVPVYLVQDDGPWIGLLHAGWRGIAGGIVEHGISKLGELAGCPPSRIVIHCGVSICGDCYEVGPEVYASVTAEVAPGKHGVDLRGLIARRAERAGVGRVTVSSWCTAHDRTTFYSHRRSGGADGRMLAYLGRPSP